MTFVKFKTTLIRADEILAVEMDGLDVAVYTRRFEDPFTFYYKSFDEASNEVTAAVSEMVKL